MNLQKKQAGPRYSPVLDPKFPSLQIQPLIDFVEGACRSQAFWVKLETLRARLQEKSRNNIFLDPRRAGIESITDLCRLSKIHTNRLQKLMVRAARTRSHLDHSIGFEAIASQTESLLETIRKARSHLYDRRDEFRRKDQYTNERSHNDRILSLADDLYDAVNDIDQFARSDAAVAANLPLCLLFGEAGTGKTHFLCDIADHHIGNGLPTVIVLAHNLEPLGRDILGAIIKTAGLRCSRQEYLRFLARECRRAGQKALILIDGINEGNRPQWKRSLTAFISEIRKYPQISVLISIRMPFQHIMIPKRLLKRLPGIVHRGFYELENEAQAAYFKYFKLPMPEVPLLSEEFSNPLFLKVFCEAMQYAVVQKAHLQIDDVASGQKGMTYVFEQFVRTKQLHISDEAHRQGIHLSPRIKSWLWNRGRNKGVIKDMADAMVAQETDYLLAKDFDDILDGYFTTNRTRSFVRRQLLSEGVLREELTWHNNKYHETVKFSYQRFSDHLLARGILATWKDGRRDFITSRLSIWEQSPNLLEALMIEVPRRTGGMELLDFIPRDKLDFRHFEAFVSGLYWRDRMDFGRRAMHYLNLSLRNDSWNRETMEALVSLSTKPKHPLNSRALDKYLRNMNMVSRDLDWSEFLRKRFDGSVIYRLLSWITEQNVSPAESYAEMYIKLIKWMLTSTNRKLRDQATKALVLLGEKHPPILMKEALASLAINDPYVLERMLAACYGALMRLHGQDALTRIQIITLEGIARKLYRQMFKRNAKHSTTHVLTRDYARGILEIMLLHDPKLFGQKAKRNIRPPYRFGGTRDWGRSREREIEKRKEGNMPIHMDFQNYTIGSLVRHRNNYDFKHNEYQKVLQQIYWRIYQLGYSLDKFGQIDIEIGSDNYRREAYGWSKIDRYGKKYSWIAFHELYGLRQDDGLLDDDWHKEEYRTANCDIDPSFPKSPHDVKVLDHNLLGSLRRNTEHWVLKSRTPSLACIFRRNSLLDIKDRWVLLEGSVDQQDEELLRGLWTSVKPVLLRATNTEAFLRLATTKKLHTDHSADPLNTYYCFAGEIPWAASWPRNVWQHAQYPVGQSMKTRRETKFIIKHGDDDVTDQEEGTEVLSKAVEVIEGNKQQSGEFEDFLSKKGLTFLIQKVRVDQPIIRYESVSVMNPVREFCWESHSQVNEALSVCVPSKELLNALGLQLSIPEWTFIDRNGRPAAIATEHREEHNNRQRALYIREDLLDSFLRKKHLTLLWVCTGTRQQIIPTKGKDAFDFTSERPYKRFRKVIKYAPTDRTMRRRQRLHAEEPRAQ